MKIEEIEEEYLTYSHSIDQGDFDFAFDGMTSLLEKVKEAKLPNREHILMLSNVAGAFIDIGHMGSNFHAAKVGLDILEAHEDELIKYIEEDTYYYNLSNAKSNLIKEKNPFNQSFETIEQLVELKSYLWKAIKHSNKNKGGYPPTYKVNLGNALKQQFRIVEALECYDEINRLEQDIPQPWINRSETLMMLNQVSNTYSIQMLEQVKAGYSNVLHSKAIPPKWVEYYRKQADYHQQKIDSLCKEEGIDHDPHDLEETEKEFQELSDFRKFCLENNLTLSEHGLYCKCAGSARDNLTIPTLAGITGDFVVPMEMVLNRLKSEFSFARRLYFEFVTHDEDYDHQHELCFSELFNEELLGLDVEKLRTAFRLCFGILDKIGVAICEFYDLYPANKQVSFQSFWQLNQGNRREKFNAVANPGLLALYSIATDLNDRKDGEWAFYKQWRNDLEHKFVVVHKEDKPSDVYKSYDFIEGIIFIKEEEFIDHLLRLFQITRSAIFSFVFTVRDQATQKKLDDAIYIKNSIYRQDYR
jgi:tetratricopeptide (TPR) repeat protein